MLAQRRLVAAPERPVPSAPHLVEQLLSREGVFSARWQSARHDLRFHEDTNRGMVLAALGERRRAAHGEGRCRGGLEGRRGAPGSSRFRRTEACGGGDQKRKRPGGHPTRKYTGRDGEERGLARTAPLRSGDGSFEASSFGLVVSLVPVRAPAAQSFARRGAAKWK